MSGFTSLGIIILSTLILAFLQLVPGVYALFSHSVYAKKSRKQRALLSTFFMLGTETVAATLLLASMLFVNVFFFFTPCPETSFVGWILAGILFALAIACLFCYYRPGAGSRLFIPRQCAATLSRYASTATTRSDAFILGALSGVLEIPFTLPLYLISALAIVKLSVANPANIFLSLIIFLAPLLPLIAIRLRFRLGYHLVDIMRAREQNKPLLRLLLCFAYATLAVLFIINIVS